MEETISLTKNQDFKAIAITSDCIEIQVNSNIDLAKAKIRILGENRNLLIEIPEPNHQSKICIYTGKPMFVELHTHNGLSVHYVEGSGKDFY